MISLVYSPSIRCYAPRDSSGVVEPVDTSMQAGAYSGREQERRPRQPRPIRSGDVGRLVDVYA